MRMCIRLKSIHSIVAGVVLIPILFSSDLSVFLFWCYSVRFGPFQLSVQFQKMNHICEYVYRYILCVKSSCSRISKQLMLTLLCLHEHQWIYMYMHRIWILSTSPPMHVCYTRRYCLLLLIMMTFLRRIFKNKSPISLSIISSLSFIFAHLCIWLLIWVCLFL